jgi:outer membrane autotransporter protein
VAATNFLNQQMIAGNALAYRPSAGAGNTYAVAGALDTGAFPGQFTDMDNIYNALDLLNAGSPAGLQAALKQLGGESYADFGFMRIMSARAFLDVMHQQMRDTRGGRSARGAGAAAERAPASLNLTGPIALAGDIADLASGLQPQLAAGGRQRGETGGVWLAPYGSAGALYGDAASHSTSYGLHGFAAGGDLAIADNALLGLSLSYADTAFATSIPGNNGANQAVSVAAYASYAPAAWYVDAAVGYAYNWGSLSRTIVFPGVFRTAQGNPLADQFLGSLEAGHAFALGPQVALTPFGRFELTASTQNGFAENGAGAISLNAAAQGTTSVRTIVGAQLSGSVSAVAAQDLWLAVRAGWAHDYADVSGALTANFLGKPDTSFTVIGPTPDRNAAIVGASVNLALRFGQAFINYDGNLAQSYATHTGMVGLKVSF